MVTTEQMTPEEEVRLRLAAGISPSTPTEYMLRHIPLWVKMSILRRNSGGGGGGTTESVTTYDFTTNTYRKNGGTVSLDDVSEFIRLSSATKWQDGKLVEVQDSIPRISGEGLLIEEQRTNLDTWVDDSLQWLWTSGVSLSATTGDGEHFGTVTQVTEDTNDGFHLWSMASPTSSIGDHYTFSLFIKPTSGRDLSVETNFFTAHQITFNFDFSTLTTAITPSSADVSSEIISLGHGFYRVIFSAVSVTARLLSKTYIYLRLTSNSNLSYVGSGGVGATVFGYQVEQDSFPTSYIPTSGTTVTRSPDILNIPLLPAQTITGDWDAGVTYSLAGGIATFTGHGYIRNITVEAL